MLLRAGVIEQFVSEALYSALDSNDMEDEIEKPKQDPNALGLISRSVKKEFFNHNPEIASEFCLLIFPAW